MNLYDIYEEYKEVNKSYVEYISELLDKKFENNENKEIAENLKRYKDRLENLKIKTDELETEDKDNLKDLQYLIVDGIFISYDLIAFYEYAQFERLKMRITNYINKVRREEHNLI